MQSYLLPTDFFTKNVLSLEKQKEKFTFYKSVFVGKKNYFKIKFDLKKSRIKNVFRLEKPKIMSLMLHAADISNAVKTWHIHQYTTSQLLQEFFNQGDMCKLS